MADREQLYELEPPTTINHNTLHSIVINGRQREQLYEQFNKINRAHAVHSDVYQVHTLGEVIFR